MEVKCGECRIGAGTRGARGDEERSQGSRRGCYELCHVLQFGNNVPKQCLRMAA